MVFAEFWQQPTASYEARWCDLQLGYELTGMVVEKEVVQSAFNIYFLNAEFKRYIAGFFKFCFGH